MTNKEKLEKLEQIKQKHLNYEFPTHKDYKNDISWLIKEVESLNERKDVYKQVIREQGEENDRIRKRIKLVLEENIQLKDELEQVKTANRSNVESILVN